jgi:Family of unknown function (DUF5701)
VTFTTASLTVDRAAPRPANSMLDDEELEDFQPIDGLEIPDGDYELAGVDTGMDLRNVTPDDALALILDSGRSPLTVEEGIALIARHPEAAAPNAGFSLLGSRCGDKRVTAIWISKGAPKLGWCWAGNPHTWLGSASCAKRIG